MIGWHHTKYTNKLMHKPKYVKVHWRNTESMGGDVFVKEIVESYLCQSSYVFYAFVR